MATAATYRVKLAGKALVIDNLGIDVFIINSAADYNGDIFDYAPQRAIDPGVLDDFISFNPTTAETLVVRTPGIMIETYVIGKVTNAGEYNFGNNLEDRLYARLDTSGTVNAGIDLSKVSINTNQVIYSPMKIYGNNGNNFLKGSVHSDMIVGGGGNDTIDPLSDFIGTSYPYPEYLYGGPGNDTFILNGDRDNFAIHEYANQGIDTVISSVSRDLKALTNKWDPNNSATSLENLTLTGTAAINGTGNELNNTLIGNSGSNTLNGGLGNDTLEGGLGQDSLTGGAGADLFRFASLSASAATFTRDIIMDFSPAAGDKIGLGLIDANTAVSGDQAFTFIGRNAFTAAGQVRCTDSNILQLNVDSNLVADSEIQLMGSSALTSASLTSANFVL